MSAWRLPRKTCASIALTAITSMLSTTAYAADAPWLSRIDGNGFDDGGTHVAVDPLGNTLVAASTVTAFSGNSEFLLLKYDRNGALLWRRNVAAGLFQSEPSGLGVDSRGNIFLAGDSQTVVGGTTASFVVKFDPNGVELWRRRLEEPSELINLSGGLAVDSNGNVVIVSTSLLEGGTYDFLVAKYDGNGTEVWRRRYDSPARLTDAGLAIGVDANNNVFVAGNSTGRNDLVASTDTTGVDFLTLKYSSTGTLLWARRAEARASGSHEHVNALAVDPAGGVAVIGFSDNRSTVNPTAEDVFIVKYDASGSLGWSYLRNGTGQFPHDYGNDIAVDLQGNIYGVGNLWETDSTGRAVTKTIVVRFDTTGRVIWERTWSSPTALSSFAKAVAIDIHGNVFVGGSIENSGGYPAGLDYLTLKYSSSGALLWAQQYHGPGTLADEIADVATDLDGAAVVTGSSFGGFDTFADIATLRYVNGDSFPVPVPDSSPPASPERPAVSRILVTRGSSVGGLFEIGTSDDRYLTLTRGSGRRDTSVQVLLEGATKYSTPTGIQASLEAAHNARGNIDRTIEFFNFQTGVYEVISRGSASTGDTVTVAEGGSTHNLSRFVQPGTGTIRTRLTFSQPTGSRYSAWQARIDQFDWRVAP